MKTWKLIGTYLLATSVCFASHANTKNANMKDMYKDMYKDASVVNNDPHDGLFLGLGASVNSLNLTQNAWGQGFSNIVTSTGAISNGVGQGNGAPFNNISNSAAPDAQIGYFKHLWNTPNLVGIKFSYQYIGSTETQPNLYIPQVGSSVNALTGATSALFGYVNADSVQITTNHQMSLLAFVGRSFGNLSLYAGAGPSIMSLKSKSYYSIGYAEFDGDTINVTGLVTYATPSVWAVGGTAQLGATYYFSPTWFVDASYAYTATGNTTFSHKENFTNTSEVTGTTFVTTGTLYTTNVISMKNQTFMLTINKVFDL